MYRSALICSVFEKSHTGSRNLLTKIEFLPATAAVESARLDYKELTFLRTSVDKDRASSVVHHLIDQGLLHIPGLENILMEGNVCEPFSPENRWLYRSEWSRWPATLFFLEPSDQYRANPSFGTLVARDAPYYKDLSHFLKDQFGINTSNPYNYLNGRVFVILPDFRARISGITIGSRYVRVEVQSDYPDPQGFLAKIYAEKDERVLCSGNVIMKGLSVEKALDDQPTVVCVAILSNGSGEPLDHRTWNLSTAVADADVTFDAPDLEVDQLLLIGESETIEFRRSVENPIRLAKTVTAFANTKGGTILVGVDDDDHRVVGCEPRGLSDRITNMVRSHCDPPPTVTTELTSYKEKQIMLVRVAASPNAVHFVREHGPYIRANGTNRVPSPLELENLYRMRRIGADLESVLS